jgi:phospholipid/cholesterol/gamma-HCH transport system substrate-binding protein
MQHTKTLDILVGLFVALGVAGLFFLAMQVSNLGSYIQNDDGFQVTARFENSGGLKVRSPVSVAGVRIGRISAIWYDQERLEAVVELLIDKQFNSLPDDTSASIFTAGLLGEQYISLEPGGSEDYLVQGSVIEITQSALVLEEIIGQFLFKDSDQDAQ